MTSRNPELYSSEADTAAREAGLVFIRDLCLSGVMIALKANCPPYGLGVQHGRPVVSSDAETLHTDLVNGIVDARTGPGRSLSDRNQDVIIQRDAFDGTIRVTTEYWDGRPVKTKFVGDKDMDANLLTGFEPFGPQRFDTIQGEGKAQKIIDDLRKSGPQTE
jgi:hypothetical protein